MTPTGTMSLDTHSLLEGHSPHVVRRPSLASTISKCVAQSPILFFGGAKTNAMKC